MRFSPTLRHHRCRLILGRLAMRGHDTTVVLSFRCLARTFLLPACLAVAAATPALFSQLPPPPPSSTTAVPSAPIPDSKIPQWEVISVKPNTSGTNSFRSRYGPLGVTSTNTPIPMLIRQAFSLFDSNDDQITGLPAWAKSDHFDIEAKVSEADAPTLKVLTPQQRGVMLQALLADRFKMVAHAVTRDLPVYALVVVKGGPKLKEAVAGDAYANGIHIADGKGGAGMIAWGRDFIDGQAIPISQLLGLLTQVSHRTVLDKTGLTGTYDIHLKWAPDEPGLVNGAPAPESAFPPLFTAIQEQLGLRLESQRGPVPGVVIDHLERPTEN